MTDITIIRDKLNADIEAVCKKLLPQGEKKGHEWRAGSTFGDKGQSLGVHLTGAKTGVWCDFSTGETGDILDLWAATGGMKLSDAIADARRWLGIAEPKASFKPKKAYKRPPKPKCTAPVGRVRDYLTEVRNIPTDVLARYQIGEAGDMIIFPFLLPTGELAMAKSRQAEDGAKPMPTAKDCEPVLFGWQAIGANCRVVVITEGEIDALSWAAYGYPAMSVPFGGGAGAKQQWIENDFERMERFEKIYLATDMDPMGEEAAVEIAARLGRHRCYRVKMPMKDGNECLVNGVPGAVMNQAIAEAVSLEPDGLRKPVFFEAAVVELFWPEQNTPVGYRTPYGKLGDKMLFRPAEMTLWSGASGAGKSQILSDCIVDWIRQQSRVCISSLEMKGAFTLKRMVKQTTGVDRPQKPFIRAALEWLTQGLLIYDLTGKAKVEALLEIFDYARTKYGCDQFIVDSLMRLGVASDDYVGQEKAVFRLVEWTIASNVHLHVVAHSRKGGSTGGAPETEDIKGAMEIGANAFNIVTVWRDRDTEDNIRKFELAKEFSHAEKLKERPGVIMNIAKQRNGDFEGKVGLWFDKNSYRYYCSNDKSTWDRNYLKLHEVS